MAILSKDRNCSQRKMIDVLGMRLEEWREISENWCEWFEQGSNGVPLKIYKIWTFCSQKLVTVYHIQHQRVINRHKNTVLGCSYFWILNNTKYVRIHWETISILNDWIAKQGGNISKNKKNYTLERNLCLHINGDFSSKVKSRITMVFYLVDRKWSLYAANVFHTSVIHLRQRHAGHERLIKYNERKTYLKYYIHNLPKAIIWR